MELKFEDSPKGYITTGFLSKHIGNGKYNERNSGIGYASPEGLLAGYFRNSLDKPSLYAAKEFTSDPISIGPAQIQAGLLAGAATGYGRPLTPLLMPEALASYKDHMLALGVVPPIKNVTPLTLALQYRKRF